MQNFFKALKQTWVKSVSAFPFLEFAEEAGAVKMIECGAIKYLVSPGSKRWLLFFDNLLGKRGGIVWSGNWDQGKIPLGFNEKPDKTLNYSEGSNLEQTLILIVDRDGNLLLLKGEEALKEQCLSGKEKVKARVAFYHSAWVEKAEKILKEKN